MQVVIDISEKMYENALNDLLCGPTTLCKAIKNGTPLPTRHEEEKKVLWKIKAEMQDIMIVSQDEERIYQEIKAIIDKYLKESEEE